MKRSELKQIIKECLKEVYTPDFDNSVTTLEDLGFNIDNIEDTSVTDGKTAYLSKKINGSTFYADVSLNGYVNNVPLNDFIKNLEPRFKKKWSDKDQSDFDDRPTEEDESLEEMTGTSAVGGALGDTSSEGPIKTPFAFSSNKSEYKNKSKKTAEQLGYKLVKTNETNEKSDFSDPEFELINEARYHNFRNHPMKEHAKLSLCLREVKKMLREIDFITNISDKLKMESGVSSSSYWNTIKERDIPEIFNRLKEIQVKLNRLTEKKSK